MISKTVKSSNLDTLDYDEKTQKLIVTFISGGVYEYSNVEPEIFDAIISEKFTNQKGQPSCGATFVKLIKNNPKYKYKKIN